MPGVVGVEVLVQVRGRVLVRRHLGVDVEGVLALLHLVQELVQAGRLEGREEERQNVERIPEESWVT